MARNVNNEKGFKILGLTPAECFEIGFGFVAGINPELICDNCNKLLNQEKEVYYICVLNRIFDKDCLVEWYNASTYYPEDSRYESLKYDTVSNYINLVSEAIDIKTL